MIIYYIYIIIIYNVPSVCAYESQTAVSRCINDSVFSMRQTSMRTPTMALNDCYTRQDCSLWGSSTLKQLNSRFTRSPVDTVLVACSITSLHFVVALSVPQPNPAVASDASTSLQWTRCCLWTTTQWDAGRTWTASCSWTRRSSLPWPSLRMWSSWSCQSQR